MADRTYKVIDLFAGAGGTVRSGSHRTGIPKPLAMQCLWSLQSICTRQRGATARKEWGGEPLVLACW